MPWPSPSGPLDDLSTPSTGFSFGIGDWITGQINDWFAALAAAGVRPLLNLLGQTLLATPDVSGSGRAFDLWKATAAIANASFLVLATAGALAAMGHETIQTRYAVKEVLPRLALACLAANTSFLLCGKAIELANAMSRALLGQDLDGQRTATAIGYLILVPSGNRQIFFILLALVAVVLLALLLITFVMRAALVLLLVVAAPLALACLALPYTDGLARFWWRAFGGLLLVQVAQSLTLVCAVRIFFNQDGRILLGMRPQGQLINLVLVLCLLIILVRIPSWITRQAFAQTRGRGSTVARIIKYALAYKLTNPVLSALHLGRGGKSSGRVTSATAALAGRVLPKVAAGAGGPAGAAAAAATAASAARGGPGAIKHAPVGARRPVRPQDWEGAPVKHAPSAPPVRGKYRPTPQPSAPVPRTNPTLGHPRETFYANGPAGLAQLQHLRDQAMRQPQAPSRSMPRRQPPVTPIVGPDAPVPGSVDWPENPGARPGPRRRNRRRGGEKS
jgi:hypothetical protein